jgi:hypothetical protein
LAAIVKFKPLERRSSFRGYALFEAIPIRHTNHKVYYDVYPIPLVDLQHLQHCCVEPGIQLHLTSDIEIKRQVHELVIRGDALQFANPAFREELGTGWGKVFLDS